MSKKLLSASLKNSLKNKLSVGSGAQSSLNIVECAEDFSGLTVIVTDEPYKNIQLHQEIKFFNKNNIPLLHFPDWETLPYDRFSPHQEITSERLKTLSSLKEITRGILFISIHALMQKLAPAHFIHAYSFSLKKGDTLDILKWRDKLSAAGYQAVSQVIAPGEFALRGSIFDIFPMGSSHPYRLDLFDNEIESIRIFDHETQRTEKHCEEMLLLPAREFPFDSNAISLFRQQWRETFGGNPSECPDYERVSKGSLPAGIEYYLPLFFEETVCLLDYFPEDTLIIKLENTYTNCENYWSEIRARYEELRHDRTRPLLSPEKLFLSPTDIFTRLKSFETFTLSTSLFAKPDITIHHKAEDPFLKIKLFLANTPSRILLCAESAGRREALLSLLHKADIFPKAIENWEDFLSRDIKLGLVVSPIDQGMALKKPDIILIPENYLVGEHIVQQRRKKTKAIEADLMIKNLTEMQIGAPVVHIDHGVGRYSGLKTLEINGISNEFLMLEYANHDKLYIPVSALHLISRYSGIDPDRAPLHKLGTEQWEKAKKKAAEQITDVAAELLELHAKREMRKGVAHDIDAQYELFAQSFPFEETPDQAQAIKAVMEDMKAPKSMDRLVCGDVGFGKTEVALRAAFIAVQNHHQVGVLVPTTLLAQQHFQNFTDRFADWPFKIEMLSRFRTKEQQKKIIESLKNGTVDIIIGTHKLLQSDIQFKALGLLIIDEEHRFGVQQKEKLKALRAEVDILTLTATPIPRTLNMSLSGMRDLSLIGTPPARRLSIKTFLHEYNLSLIREAILREIMRGGQVYFLHNDVETINKTADKLKETIPQAQIVVAHGQMHERELENIMRAFYHQQYNVLVCTTIIETGIDIPSANTIIIERADKFGLAQLHQLRGRVGRSHHQAYAYLLTPSGQKISADAEKRLEAITKLEDLGAGFALATHDLEIRGAGEILGEHQSGNIQEIGFSLYMELLERAVNSLKKGEKFDLAQATASSIEVDLHIPALIPDDYLMDVHARLVQYKRIASATSFEELNELKIEFIDRFGLLPQALKNLFLITEIKLNAETLGILKIAATEKSTRILFKEKTPFDPMKIIMLLQKYPQTYKLENATQLKITKDQQTAEDKIKHIEEFIALIA